MTTSGTTVFAPDMQEMVEEAYERAGLTARTGYDFRTARRSLNFMFMEWANRGVHLWSIDSNTVPLLANTPTYTLPADTVDLLDVVIRTTTAGVNTDIAIARIPLSHYASLPNKASPGRPVQFYVDRQRDAPLVTIWPVPSDTTYTLVYWRMRRLQDAGVRGDATPDVPFRLVPALVAGLAYHIALKRPEVANRAGDLKSIYDEAMMEAIGEDRDRSSARLVPSIRS